MPHFNPRSPCGERQLRTAFQIQKFYISIHAPRAGSDGNLRLHCPLHCQISIHAPRAGSDPSLLLVQGGLTHISIHAPRAGSDAPTAPICSMRAAFQSTLPVRGATSTAIVGMRWQTIFQSTLPVRGATARTRSVCSVWYYFNPRSPCGERRRTVWVQHTEIAISIHAPRAGSDVYRFLGWSTLFISIHAPRAGSDKWLTCLSGGGDNFNPRSPCGERRDMSVNGASSPNDYFNPRSPCGERQRRCPKRNRLF